MGQPDYLNHRALDSARPWKPIKEASQCQLHAHRGKRTNKNLHIHSSVPPAPPLTAQQRTSSTYYKVSVQKFQIWEHLGFSLSD